MKRDKLNSIIGIVIVIILFLASSYFAQEYFNEGKIRFDVGIYGMIFYVVILIISIVIAPVSAMPLIPLASSVWGWVVSGVLSVIGWTIGAVIAFLIARRFGVPIVSKLLPMKSIYKFENKIPERNLFLSVVFLRMVVPVDGLSYFLGLFSKMSLRNYTLATIIGIIPFSFLLAYVGTIDFYYQLIFLSVVLFITLIILLIVYFKKKVL